jgi:hypothetical protein
MIKGKSLMIENKWLSAQGQDVCLAEWSCLKEEEAW